MAVFEVTSRCPAGAEGLVRALAADTSGAFNPYQFSDKAKAWVRKHDLATCRRRSGHRTAALSGWVYEITETGRTFLRQLDEAIAQEPAHVDR